MVLQKYRRKSVDSSSSSSESSESRGKHKKEAREARKKEKEVRKQERKREKEERKRPTGSIPLLGGLHQMTQGQQSNFVGDGIYHQHPEYRAGGDQGGSPRHPGQPNPPPYVPPSGYRIPLTTQTAFPDPRLGQTGPPAFYDADGVSPVFIGSAIMEKSVHPCKIGPHLRPFASVPYGGREYGHQGRFDLLPFNPDLMEWVRTSRGIIPPGRRPVEGGYEENGPQLYHAAAVVNDIKVPGKTGEHL